MIVLTNCTRTTKIVKQWCRIRNHSHDTTSTTTTPHKHYLIPKRILLLRHGESLGNIDETVYSKIPDWKIPLTRKGVQEAQSAGKQLIQTITTPEEDDDSSSSLLYTYVSPYYRTLQTWEHIQQQIVSHNTTITTAPTKPMIHLLGTREDPRIAEQQFGNFQNPEKVLMAKEERHSFGRFFFRFPNGESGLDVYNRASSFFGSLSRDIKDFRLIEQQPMNNCNILIITHGLTLRLILMRYFQLSVPEFEASYNPPNAQFIIMNREIVASSSNDDHEDTTMANKVPKKNRYTQREYFRLENASRDLLNFKGDITNKKFYWRPDLGNALDPST